MSERYGTCPTCEGIGRWNGELCGGCFGTGFYGGLFPEPKWQRKKRDHVPFDWNAICEKMSHVKKKGFPNGK